MIKLIDVTYYVNNFQSLEELFDAQKESLGYIPFIKDQIDIQVIKHLDYTGSWLRSGINSLCFKSANRFLSIPLKTNRFIKKEYPDVILVQGLSFPLQVIFLRWQLGKRCIIVAQHHGERPQKGIKKTLQKIADRFIDAYTFTAIGNADSWLNEKVIRNKDKCYEVLEASTYLTRADKEKSKQELGFEGNYNFLWVGRLEENKDPLTVLKGMSKYMQINPAAKLYMIYQKDGLLSEVEQMIEADDFLKRSVCLVGEVSHNVLPTWLSAADYFITGSLRESTGYALLEAMACGCIPVVTNIPSFKKITDSGRYGALYETGNPDSLFQTLLNIEKVPQSNLSIEIIDHFQKNLSFRSIAKDIYNLCNKLLNI